MSNTLASYLKKHPLLIAYIQNGFVNLNALARFIKKNKKGLDSTSLPALSMELRRYISNLPKQEIISLDFSKYSLQLVTRTNIHELIMNKTAENRQECLNVVNTISKTKYFISLIEGEKEMVVMTDYPVNKILDDQKLKEIITHVTGGLGFISVNFPIELRQVPGVYNFITFGLVEAKISIHSFHTIGGEILILVKNEDLTRTQEVLKSLLVD
ncbi:hypothetical protein A2866_04665 [Candidatus Roizmanbacteria bacterium RIFCSPHIGHO2_01_FULL_39_8]|uniref:Aspartate kinase n=3 Tax=Candidatus Roizmaniibacteriota TaxID=1752723 RepID=A0A1F7GND2_9BACT|nr:MAG: hypothetical protein A2866_04665 [Candidatus Roizmanbacteria bacterium RIFCSPHIGHO2_01_FULL_39_8]OGK27238.1 MAG: hypothetical protein A3C28_04365 [Candidatus Roizmanbacteria bacterium RIFCSPHIGHO2_02_FULL_39_9]OGK35828.1 MAG: hypothetical protein A3F60_00750 [Candidatus Roizmanbacteria bacterium RIFCSPHIGHO2_12_FULL_39_8]